MKRAILSPLLKNPSLDTELYPNFRPVSNLMLVSKTTEKVTATQLWEYLCSTGLNVACVASVSNRVIARKLEWKQKKVEAGGGEERLGLEV